MVMEADEVGLEVRSSVTVKLPRDEAFALFTERIGSWWPRTRHSVYGAEAVGVTMEPRVGGPCTKRRRMAAPRTGAGSRCGNPSIGWP